MAQPAVFDTLLWLMQWVGIYVSPGVVSLFDTKIRDSQLLLVIMHPQCKLTIVGFPKVML